MGGEEVKVCEMTILPIMPPFALPVHDSRSMNQSWYLHYLMANWVGLGWDVLENEPHVPEQLFGSVVASLEVPQWKLEQPWQTL